MNWEGILAIVFIVATVIASGLIKKLIKESTEAKTATDIVISTIKLSLPGGINEAEAQDIYNKIVIAQKEYKDVLDVAIEIAIAFKQVRKTPSADAKYSPKV